ncbi:MAG: hypothetical protein WC889_15095 [Myxococcota bacterium]
MQDATRPYPLLEVYSAFADACDDLHDLDRANARLLESGWAKTTPGTAEPMGRLLSFLREQASKQFEAEGGTPLDPLTFTRSVKNRNLELMLQAVEIEGGVVNGCRMWDFTAPKPSGQATLVELRAEAPTRVVDRDGLVVAEWAAEEALGRGSMQIVFIDDTHEAAKLTGAAGLSFKSSFTRVNEE